MLILIKFVFNYILILDKIEKNGFQWNCSMNVFQKKRKKIFIYK